MSENPVFHYNYRNFYRMLLRRRTDGNSTSNHVTFYPSKRAQIWQSYLS